MGSLYLEVELKQKLTPKEQNKYLQLAQSGDNKAKEKILEHNFRLVTYVINRYYKDLDEETKKELFSVGCLELWKIIQKFDIESRNEFSTYAIPSIYGSMRNYVRDNNLIHIPKNIKELFTKITHIQNEYSNNNNGEELTINSLSKITGESEKNIILAYHANQIAQSLYFDNDDKNLTKDRISNDDILIYETIEQNEIYNELRKSINKLSKNQKITIVLLFGLDGQFRNQKEISQLLNISESRVSKLKKTAIKNLQQLIPQYIKDEYSSKVKTK